MVYYFKKIKFEKLDVVLRLYKKMNKSLEEVLSQFSNSQNRNFILMNYDDISEMTVSDALALQNAEQRMIALTVFTPEEIVENINAELLDEQKIHKKQLRWKSDLTPYYYEYYDVYALYKISAFELGLENIARTPSIYFVKCSCTSTSKVYYLYVPEAVAAQNDAIVAIAWTFRFNNQPLSKEQYLHFIKSET